MQTFTAVIAIACYAASALRAVGLACKIAQYARTPTLGVDPLRTHAEQLRFRHFVAGHWGVVGEYTPAFRCRS